MADEAAKYESPVVADLDRDGALEARIRARAEIDRLNAIDNAEKTDEDIAGLEAALNDIDAIDARVAEVDAESAAREERLAALAERAGAVTDPVEPGEDSGADADAEAAAEVTEPEAVVASGTKRPVARAAAGKATPTKINKAVEKDPVWSVTASAGFAAKTVGDKIESSEELAEAFLSRVQGFGGSNPADMEAGVYAMSPRAVKHGVATFRRTREHEVNKEMSFAQQMEVILDAGRDPGIQALVAAGGWCAPSEIDYSLSGYETAEGLVDVPEVTARRGGIQFTKGPDFMTVFADADAGFIQTEAQAIAGEVKPCYALECPPFQEVRLDAIGFCATAPLLTEAAYPELVARVLSLLNLGHQRRKSASTIARIRALITTTVNWGEIGTPNSGVADLFAGIEMQANRIRQALAMSPTATIEGIAPYWLRGALRNELARRLSLPDPFNITDGDVDGWLALRGIRLQPVYDYQMLGTGAANTEGGTNNWTEWPAQVEIMMYPAGAFTRLVNDVANLSAVYDHDLLTQNQYTAAFVEEGLAVANTRGFGIKATFGLSYVGAAGYPGIGDLTNVAPTP